MHLQALPRWTPHALSKAGLPLYLPEGGLITCLDDQLRRDEGWRSKPYKDSVGKVTIGYGRNLDDVGLNPDEGALMLVNDIKNATARLETAFPWVLQLDETRKGALLNMTFNMGIGGLAQFKDFLGHMRAGEWDDAASAMLDSKWAEQVGSRARRLAVQIEEGTWQ